MDGHLGMRGPFSVAFDAMLIRELGIKTVIAKESGDQGGLSDKITACRQTGCKLLIIARPPMQYPQVESIPGKCLPWIQALTKAKNK